VHRGEGAPRALCGETRTPRPQSTRQHESGSQLEGFLFSKSNRSTSRFFPATSNASRRACPHFVPAGRIAPADGVGAACIQPRGVSQTGHNEVSNQGLNGTGSLTHQILHDRHADLI
jgi:hypothetical protein